MKANLELGIKQLTLILSRYEAELMSGEKVYYGQRNVLCDIYKQLNAENKEIFNRELPLLSKEIFN